MPTEKEKKEKVLHTRISESLDEEIREHAANLGVSVSNLVRNVLQNAFGLVGDIVADTAVIARTARKEAEEAPGMPAPPAILAPQAPPRVLGWQEAILNLNAVCGVCNALLAKGTRAVIAVAEGSGPRAICCLDCIKELTDESEAQ